MISVAAPLIFGTAVFGAFLTCVLHFLSVRRPPLLLLPTMRFLPERPLRAVSRSARPSDLWLLLLRVAALLLAGVALSGVTWRGTGVKHGRVIVYQPTASFNGAFARTELAKALEGGFAADTVARIVVVDSVAHLLNAIDSRRFRAESVTNSPKKSRSSATLSAAILAATRAAAELVREERTVDAIDLVIAGPMVQSSVDAALPVVRASWPGTIRLVDTRHTPDVVDSLAPIAYKRAITLAGALPSDAVRSAFEARGWLAGANVRTPQTALADTTRVPVSAATSAPISVEWPASGLPEGWSRLDATTVGALIARGEALVFPFVRSARISEAMLVQGRAIAWWSDGEVAAVEVPTATSCTRHVGVTVPAGSDVLQGQAARALLSALSGPCGGESDGAPIAAATLKSLEGAGGAAPANAFKSTAAVQTQWAPWLLLLTLVLLSVEWFVRDREDRVAAAGSDTTVRKVA